ncbi:MAG: AbrB family transcriptional regulator [Synergistaceae bacterium]|nr:AbrB family transcriptional regulator [Synergistaceae bacterium]MDD4430925.1 AbrB family transcriptional regulator [Bacteroidales bacterium]
MNLNYMLLFAVLGGSAIGHKSGFPAGALIGGLLAGLVIKGVMQMGLDPKIAWLSWISQALVAYVLVRGSDFSSIAEIPRYLPAAMAYSFSLLIFTIGMAWFFSKLCKMDFLTSLFATTPGGLTGIAVVAVDIGADPIILVLFNICRIVTILIVVPIIANIIVRY